MAGSKVLERILGTQPEPNRHFMRDLYEHELREAKQAWADHRLANGLSAVAWPLLTDPTGNFKLNKSVVPTYGLALSPATSSGLNVCPSSTPECRKHCVSYAGKGALARVQRARIVRTTFLAANPQAFLTLLVDEVDRAVLKHGRINLRLNTFSDLAWERIAPWLFTRWGSAVAFYDYTKRWERETPENYQLTLSASERTSHYAIAGAVVAGRSVAVVVNVRRMDVMPATFGPGLPMVDGDKTDDRTLDHAVVVGLRPKGTMSGKGSPMVFQVTP